MLLYPSTPNFWNATFSNVEGQIIYKTEYSMRFSTARQITIKRILPSNSIDLATASEDALRDSFSNLAEIHYGFLSSRIRYNGIDMATSQFLRKSGIFGGSRIFTGTDGKEYEWDLKTNGKLYLKDAPRTLVASYRPTIGIAVNATSSLEFFPEGQHMADLIFITFIFLFVEGYFVN